MYQPIYKLHPQTCENALEFFTPIISTVQFRAILLGFTFPGQNNTYTIPFLFQDFKFIILFS